MYLFHVAAGEALAANIVLEDGQIKAENKIHLIKIFYQSIGCSLYEAKEFADRFLDDLNRALATPTALRSQVRMLLDDIDDVEALMELKRLAKKVKKADDPSPFW